MNVDGALDVVLVTSELVYLTLATDSRTSVTSMTMWEDDEGSSPGPSADPSRPSVV